MAPGRLKLASLQSHCKRSTDGAIADAILHITTNHITFMFPAHFLIKRLLFPFKFTSFKFEVFYLVVGICMEPDDSNLDMHRTSIQHFYSKDFLSHIPRGYSVSISAFDPI